MKERSCIFAHVGGKRELNLNWRGGRRKDKRGYIQVYLPEHPRAKGNGYVGEHVLVCESALGKYLPQLSVPHHVNCIQDDNANSNLVICQNESYHQLLHKRMRALREGGNANWGKCQFCKQYDDTKNLIQRGNSSTFHRLCYNAYNRQYHKSRKEESRKVKIQN